MRQVQIRERSSESRAYLLAICRLGGIGGGCRGGRAALLGSVVPDAPEEGEGVVGGGGLARSFVVPRQRDVAPH